MILRGSRVALIGVDRVVDGEINGVLPLRTSGARVLSRCTQLNQERVSGGENTSITARDAHPTGLPF